MAILHNDWQPLLEEEFQKAYYLQLRAFLKEEYRGKEIYPDMKDIFLGQDPYHGKGQAHGLSFSVKPGIQVPPSLQNIYKELSADLGCSIPNNGYLSQWAEQGVLMLNAVLTVHAGSPNSHRGKGWEAFTDQVIARLNEREKPLVFMLWGRNAHEKAHAINHSRHYVLQSPHPSPLSVYKGFFGSRPFSKANAFLAQTGQAPIDWQIPDL